MIEVSTKEIETFLAVAKYQNISQAARHLYISQSAVSNWIAKMEDTCKIKLFHRSRQGVSLTEEGAELYSKLDVAYNRFRVSVEDICAEHIYGENTLRLGAVNRLHVMKYERIFALEMGKKYPELEIISKDYNFHEVRDKALCGELDIIFTLSTDVEMFSEFEYVSLSEYPAYFIVSKEFSALCDSDISQALSGKKLLVETVQQKQWATKICSSCDVEPIGTEYVNSYITMAMQVAKGDYFSIDDKIGTERFFLPEISYIAAPCTHEARIVAAWPKHRITEKIIKFKKLFSP